MRALILYNIMINFIVILLFQFSLHVWAGGNVTLSTIYQVSKAAIDSDDLKANMDVVAKHYFTREKENSAWYVGQKQALELLNMEMSMADLKFQEKLVRAVQYHYETCLKMKKGILQAQCFYHISSLLRDLEHGSRWITGKGISKMNKAKFGTLYNIAGTLIAHMSLIAKKHIKQFKHKNIFDHKMLHFTNVLFTIHRILNEFGNTIVHFKMDTITPPIVCEIFERFWKEFTGMCETRWKRGIEDDDESDLEQLAEEFQATEEDPRLYAADKIGNSCKIGPKRCKKYRVQIIDNVKKEVIYQDYKYAEFTNRGETMVDLAKKAQVFRNEAVKKAWHTMERFSNATYIVNQDIILDTLHLIVKDQQNPEKFVTEKKF